MLYRNILLVDDDPDDQEVFLAALQNIASGTSCIMSNDGIEALEMLTTKKVTPELIVIDLNMPRMDGRELLITLKEDKELKHIPVIIFSTASLPATRVEMLSLGADKFITKPFGFSKLELILSALLNGSLENFYEYN